MLGSALVTLAALATVGAGRVGLLPALSLALVVVPPPLMALVGVCCEIVDEAEPSFSGLLGHLRRLTVPAIGICAVPLILAGLTMTALLAYGRGGGAVMLVPAAFGATATVMALVCALVLLPMRASAAGMTGRRVRLVNPHLWLLSLHLAARTPLPFLAAAVVGGLGIALSLTVSNSLFLLVPAPFAFVVAAASKMAPGAPEIVDRRIP
ncbi:hypothetical protein [Brachybacterium sp. GCM10030252]|uniref:hypothetical protein n=1 Tax=Brachybacterium sp. GCM10030252 TaxID=3273380 RepID=UPI0036096EF1